MNEMMRDSVVMLVIDLWELLCRAEVQANSEAKCEDVKCNTIYIALKCRVVWCGVVWCGLVECNDRK
jgi:hypothetical protein